MNPIHLIPHIPFEKLTAEASRLWGAPALPEGTDYPTYTDEDGDDCPYVFICQINLEELHKYAPRNPLPAKGMLSFFAKIDHYLGHMGDCDLSGYVSEASEVKVLYFTDTDNMREVVLIDDDNQPLSPDELEIEFTKDAKPLGEDHALFAVPDHRPWETWEPPFEDWTILLQIDSFEGKDFVLNFMDFGVLDFLISPQALEAADFSDVRGIVLST